MEQGMEKDYMKKWEKPGLAMLNAADTKETRDFPHYWECNACKKHLYSLIDGEAPEKCYSCGNTKDIKGFTFRLFAEESDSVMTPNYGGPALGTFDTLLPSNS